MLVIQYGYRIIFQEMCRNIRISLTGVMVYAFVLHATPCGRYQDTRVHAVSSNRDIHQFSENVKHYSLRLLRVLGLRFLMSCIFF